MQIGAIATTHNLYRCSAPAAFIYFIFCMFVVSSFFAVKLHISFTPFGEIVRSLREPRAISMDKGHDIEITRSSANGKFNLSSGKIKFNFL